MEIAIKSLGGSIDLVVTGTIKTVTDAQSIKDTIQRTNVQYPNAILRLVIKDSFIITSSVIGFLVKSIKVDGIPLNVHVCSNELYEMLDDMNLIDTMNVKKVSA